MTETVKRGPGRPRIERPEDLNAKNVELLNVFLKDLHFAVEFNKAPNAKINRLVQYAEALIKDDVTDPKQINNLLNKHLGE